MNLKKYQEKRDFKKTTEPGMSREKKEKYRDIFVIQKHAASRLHYDFRIEIDDVLVSWAVPKGPSTDPREKRLAIRTEDHPLEYADFEGSIPEDQYGSGIVIVWDRGKYENQRDISMSEALEEGKLEIWLKGQKIQGGYHFIRMKKQNEDKEQWLFMKARDDKADARRNPVSTEPESVVSNHTIQQLKESGRKNNRQSS